MEPRNGSQPWPSGNVPVRSWTKSIQGVAYTIKRIEGDLFGIWRDVEELGTFELDRGAPDGFRSPGAKDLTLEARAVVREFIHTSRQFPDGPATRD